MLSAPGRELISPAGACVLLELRLMQGQRTMIPMVFQQFSIALIGTPGIAAQAGTARPSQQFRVDSQRDSQNPDRLMLDDHRDDGPAASDICGPTV